MIYNLGAMSDSAAKRPRSLTITLLGVIGLGAWNAGRVFALMQQNSLLLDLGIKPDPRIRLAMAFLWIILFWAAAIALWRRRPLTSRAIPFLIATYSLYELALVALYVRVPVSGRHWLLNVLLVGIAVSFSYWALNRPAAETYFERRD